MNSVHSHGFKCRSNGARLGFDGSMDGDSIELQDTASTFADEATPPACCRSTPCLAQNELIRSLGAKSGARASYRDNGVTLTGLKRTLSVCDTELIGHTPKHGLLHATSHGVFTVSPRPEHRTGVYLADKP